MYLIDGKEFDNINVTQNWDNDYTEIDFTFGEELIATRKISGYEFAYSIKELISLDLGLDIQHIPTMSIWEVETGFRGYDTYDGFVAIAESKKDVVDLIQSQKYPYTKDKIKYDMITKLADSNEAKSRIVLSSFNAG